MKRDKNATADLISISLLLESLVNSINKPSNLPNFCISNFYISKNRISKTYEYINLCVYFFFSRKITIQTRQYIKKDHRDGKLRFKNFSFHPITKRKKFQTNSSSSSSNNTTSRTLPWDTTEISLNVYEIRKRSSISTLNLIEDSNSVVRMETSGPIHPPSKRKSRRRIVRGHGSVKQGEIVERGRDIVKTKVKTIVVSFAWRDG